MMNTPEQRVKRWQEVVAKPLPTNDEDFDEALDAMFDLFTDGETRVERIAKERKERGEEG